VCGNGVCEAGETSATCGSDCVDPQLVTCKGNCSSYDFFHCFDPGQLQTCNDKCQLASAAQREQFNNCAGTATVSCDKACLSYLP
jgi:hypothetical protein